MPFAREIHRLLAGLLIGFVVVTLAAAYWGVRGTDTILRRADNPRAVLRAAALVRGDLVDRSGAVLVTTEPGRLGGAATRRYHYPDMYSALGYFSQRYGVSGAEAAYDAVLRGSNLEQGAGEFLGSTLLHLPQRGADVRLTLDMNVQTTVAQLLAGRQGAAVVLDVPTGEVLALVSLPTFDPNTLDTDWEALREAPGRPFFNRALQGSYQPGSALQTPLIAAALARDLPLDNPIPEAARPVEVDDVSAGCAVRLPDVALTLREAYTFACPAAFVELAQTLGANQVEAALRTFRLDALPTLPGFAAQTRPLLNQSAIFVTEHQLVETAIGQSRLTVSPLTMALIAAAVVNDGNAPQPYALLETRPPGGAWQPVANQRPTVPLATVATARQLQDLMREAVANGAAQNAGRPNVDIGGHAGIAYSGAGSQAWFVGFATLGVRRGVAVAVVIEDSADPGLAADIGGAALAAAAGALREP